MRVSVAEMSGRSSSVAALLAMMVMMMAMLITQTHGFSINQTITVSYSAACDGLNDDLPCLVGQTDLDSDEFMLDSEFSRRILKTLDIGQKYVGKTNNRGRSAACDRKDNARPCHTDEKNKKPKEQCKGKYKRDCYRYPPK